MNSIKKKILGLALAATSLLPAFGQNAKADTPQEDSISQHDPQKYSAGFDARGIPVYFSASDQTEQHELQEQSDAVDYFFKNFDSANKTSRNSWELEAEGFILTVLSEFPNKMIFENDSGEKMAWLSFIVKDQNSDKEKRFGMSLDKDGNWLIRKAWKQDKNFPDQKFENNFE